MFKADKLFCTGLPVFSNKVLFSFVHEQIITPISKLVATNAMIFDFLRIILFFVACNWFSIEYRIWKFVKPVNTIIHKTTQQNYKIIIALANFSLFFYYFL